MPSPSTKTRLSTFSAHHSENYNAIDLVKFLCAIMVFTIHFPPFAVENSTAKQMLNFLLQNCLCRLAVPFYFIVSGFFLFRKMSFDNLNFKTIKNYCFKMYYKSVRTCNTS